MRPRGAFGVVAALVLTPTLTLAQAGNARKLFADHCAGCHGADARGSDRGPALAFNLRVRRRSVEQLRDFIRKGAPSSGMPAFALPIEDR